MLVRDLRAEGLSEASIVVVLGVTGRIYRYAARRLGWSGTNPVALMLPSERPKPSRAQRRRIFEGELEQTIAAAREPRRTMLIVAALTGGRISELCGLTWADVRLDDLADAEIEFGWQVDRKGNRTPTKTDGSARTVPIPRALAVILARHKLASRISAPEGYVFRHAHRAPALPAQCRSRPAHRSARRRRRARTAHIPGSARAGCRGQAGQGAARLDSFYALLSAYGDEPSASRGRERGRDRLPARAP